MEVCYDPQFTVVLRTFLRLGFATAFIIGITIAAGVIIRLGILIGLRFIRLSLGWNFLLGFCLWRLGFFRFRFRRRCLGRLRFIMTLLWILSVRLVRNCLFCLGSNVLRVSGKLRRPLRLQTLTHHHETKYQSNRQNRSNSFIYPLCFLHIHSPTLISPGHRLSF